jgi:putative acetyltransferase
MSELTIRAELPGDASGVRRVNEQAFGRRDEADLIERLHAGGKVIVALVAEQDRAIVGHILFSPVTIEGAAKPCTAVALAPMAVLPSHQRRGIGRRLVEEGIIACKELGYTRIIVLGHPQYYPWFGFGPAKRYGLHCEYNAPDEAFMALALEPDAFRDCAGLVKFAPEFADV